MKRRWKNVKVVERYQDIETKVPKELLSCGHTRTDPDLYYSNQTGFKVKRLAETLSQKLPRARCYKCAEESNEKKKKD